MTRAKPPLDLIVEDYHVTSTPSGIKIHLRRKRPAAANRDSDPPPVIFVHGATFSGLSAFDAPLPGGSWLDFIASHGRDAYALDVRGYGLSLWPDCDAPANPLGKPYVRTEEAIQDLSAVVDFVLARTGAKCVDLVGWSWGTAICGGYTSRNNSKVGRLVLYAPLWIIEPALPISKAWLPALGLFYSWTLAPNRSVTLQEVQDRWFRGLDEKTAEMLCPRAMLHDWWNYTTGINPDPNSLSPSVLRAPNGVLADLAEFWSAGMPTYEPEKIVVPVLAILGEWDVDTPPYMAQELFRRLNAALYKRLEILGQGTHSMCLEVHRFELYRRVQQFLDTDLG